jgi:hypothetical protein
MDDMPLDFAQYLSERLGVTVAETNLILGDWLKEYEPLAESQSELPSRTSLAKTAPEDAEPFQATA